MDVIVVLVFISLVLVLAALAFFLSRLREGDFEHGERLALLPLADDGESGQAPDEQEKIGSGPSKEGKAAHE